MTTLLRLVMGYLVGSLLLLAGCGKDNSPPPVSGGAATAPADHDDDVAHSEDHDLEHADGTAHEGEDGDDHVEADRVLGVITIGTMEFEVSIDGMVEPNAEIEVLIEQLTGLDPSTMRVWIGVESGIGSMKMKTHAHDIEHHATVEAPSDITADTALWIEVENRNRERMSGSISL
ncbi:MAG: hypothetical protein ACYTGR_10800 [Planctomycetota bacterium]